MAIVGILGCTALLVCAFGMQDSMNNIIRWNYEDINLYETKLELSGDVRPDQVNALIDKYHGEAMMEGAVELKAGSIKKSGELLVTDHVKLIQFVDHLRDPISLPKDSISISYKMADMLKVKTGDQISWHIYGDEKWITSKVGAIYRTPFTQGISMTKECFEKLGFTFAPTSVITLETVTLKDPGVSKYQSKSMITKGYETFTEAMNTMVIVLVIAAVILAGVVIYNLGVLSFTERQRELSTLKVIGFKTKKLRTLLLTQNIWLTAVGIIPGIPIGKWVLGYIFTFLGDVFDFMPVITFQSYLYSIAGTFLISIAVNRLFSKRVKKIDMVSSLKGVE
jgi:putative ABC transport system permease protein